MCRRIHKNKINENCGPSHLPLRHALYLVAIYVCVVNDRRHDNDPIKGSMCCVCTKSIYNLFLVSNYDRQPASSRIVIILRPVCGCKLLHLFGCCGQCGRRRSPYVRVLGRTCYFSIALFFLCFGNARAKCSHRNAEATHSLAR